MTHKDIRPTKARVVLSVGESVRIVRELQGLTQSELARRAKILRSPRSQPSKTIPSIWESNGLKSGACSAVPSRRPGVSWLGRDQAIRCLTVATVTLSNSASCSRTICRLQDLVTFLFYQTSLFSKKSTKQRHPPQITIDKTSGHSIPSSNLVKNSIRVLRQAQHERITSRVSMIAPFILREPQDERRVFSQTARAFRV